MENELPASETPPKEPIARGLPKGSSFPAPSPKPTLLEPDTPEPDERNGVFRHLVTDDSDIAGLVAYSIYKQNKLDWLTAFEKSKGRVPNDGELSSYIIGEGTPRRLATYRHLAEATLAGNGPEIGGAGPGQSARGASRRPGNPSERRAMTTGLVAAYALVAVLFVLGFLLAAHYTMTSR